MSSRDRHLATHVIHAGEEPRVKGAVVMPVFQSAMYEYAGESEYQTIPYVRLNNTPNHRALHEKLATLEGSGAALVAGSGMSAISSALMSLFRSGDHVLMQDCLYGGTHSLAQEYLPHLGVRSTPIAGNDPESWEKALEPDTKGIYVEAMTNPMLEVADLRAVVDFARAHDLISLIDNTFATPVNFRPIEVGFDVVLHSATKYLNGHSDIVAGVVAATPELIDRINRGLSHFGGTLDPHACFLLHRGIKTLALRMARHNQNGLRVATALEELGLSVNYPGLPSHKNHPRARELFGGFGGMLSFELESAEVGDRFIHALGLALHAPSLGGVETLATRPATSSHSGVPKAERDALGITDGLVRVSVGIEDPDDLVADFTQALKQI